MMAKKEVKPFLLRMDSRVLAAVVEYTRPDSGAAMSWTVVLNHGSVHVPERVSASLKAFREGAGDNDLPEKTRLDFYKGEVWVDTSQKQLFTHGSVKTEIAAVLHTISKQAQLGRYCRNGILVTNLKADVSGNPDGTYVSYEALSAGRATLTEVMEGGYVEVVGTVDMVLEVVSNSSEKKAGWNSQSTVAWATSTSRREFRPAGGSNRSFSICRSASIAARTRGKPRIYP